MCTFPFSFTRASDMPPRVLWKFKFIRIKVLVHYTTYFFEKIAFKPVFIGFNLLNFNNFLLRKHGFHDIKFGTSYFVTRTLPRVYPPTFICAQKNALSIYLVKLNTLILNDNCIIHQGKTAIRGSPAVSSNPAMTLRF